MAGAESNEVKCQLQDIIFKYSYCRSDEWDILFCGDLNARTPELFDSKFIAAGCETTSSFSADIDSLEIKKERIENHDKYVNMNCEFVVDLCKESGCMWVCNGRMFPNELIFYGSNGRSNCDCWCSTARVLDCGVARIQFYPLSDHACIMATITCVSSTGRQQVVKVASAARRQNVWVMDRGWLQACREGEVIVDLLDNGEVHLAVDWMEGAAFQEDEKFSQEAMECFMEAVENTALVRWEKKDIKLKEFKFGKGHKDSVLFELKSKFHGTQRRWRSFNELMKNSGDLDVIAELKVKEKFLLEEMIEQRRAVRAHDKKIKMKKQNIKMIEVRKRLNDVSRRHEWWSLVQEKKKVQVSSVGIEEVKDLLIKEMGACNEKKVLAPEELLMGEAEPFDWESDENQAILKLLKTDEFWIAKRGKAVGEDGWPSELVGALRDCALGRKGMDLVDMNNWRFGILPKYSITLRLQTIPKGGRKIESVLDLTGISLMSIIRGLLETNCMKSLASTLQLRWSQGGFRKKHKTIVRAICLLGLLSVARIRGWNFLWCAFLGFSIFFDKIHCDLCVWRLRQRLEVGNWQHLIKFFVKFNKQSKLVLQHLGEKAGAMAIGNRVPQGGTWSPLLADVVLDGGCGRALDGMVNSLEVDNNSIPTLGGLRVSHVMYADDLTVVNRFNNAFRGLYKGFWKWLRLRRQKSTRRKAS